MVASETSSTLVPAFFHRRQRVATGIEGQVLVFKRHSRNPVLDRTVGGFHLQSGTIGDDLDRHGFALTRIIRLNIPDIVQHQIQHRRVILIDVNGKLVSRFRQQSRSGKKQAQRKGTQGIGNKRHDALSNISTYECDDTAISGNRKHTYQHVLYDWQWRCAATRSAK